MATVITDSKNYSDIAAAIRAKTESSGTYKPSEMAAAIGSIEVRPENTCYIGTAVPESTFGKDGDIFIVKEE